MVTEHRVQASARAREALPSPIRKLTPLADRAKAQGVHIYHLNIGQPDILTPAALMRGIREYDAPILPYAPSQGLSETIDAWREYYAHHGIELERNQLLVTTGGSEALLFGMMAVADPGDEIIVFEPTYANYFGFAGMSSIHIVPVAVKPEEGYHLPPVEQIEQRITPRTRALLFCSPENPTGTVYSYDELEVLSDIALRHGLFLISDETYREIVFDGPRDMSMMKVAATAGQTIVVDSVSKRFSATGMRVGCLISRNHEVTTAALRMAMARLSTPTIEQMAVVPLLENPTAYTTWLRGVYQSRRDATYTAVRAIPGVSVARPEGAFYVMIQLPVPDSQAFARWLLTDFERDGETVMVAPGPGFYVGKGRGASEVRLAFVLAEEHLRRAIPLLEEALAAYPLRQAA